MSGFNFVNTTKHALYQKLIDLIDADTNPGYIETYTGTQPAAGAAVPGGSLKTGTFTLTKPCATYSSGTMTFATINDDVSADNSGTMTWCRIYDGAGNIVADGDVALGGSTALLRFQNTNVAVAGGRLQILSFTVTM